MARTTRTNSKAPKRSSKKASKAETAETKANPALETDHKMHAAAIVKAMDSLVASKRELDLYVSKILEVKWKGDRVTTLLPRKAKKAPQDLGDLLKLLKQLQDKEYPGAMATLSPLQKEGLSQRVVFSLLMAVSIAFGSKKLHGDLHSKIAAVLPLLTSPIDHVAYMLRYLFHPKMIEAEETFDLPSVFMTPARKGDTMTVAEGCKTWGSKTASMLVTGMAKDPVNLVKALDSFVVVVLPNLKITDDVRTNLGASVSEKPKATFEDVFLMTKKRKAPAAASPAKDSSPSPATASSTASSEAAAEDRPAKKRKKEKPNPTFKTLTAELQSRILSNFGREVNEANVKFTKKGMRKRLFQIAKSMGVDTSDFGEECEAMFSFQDGHFLQAPEDVDDPAPLTATLSQYYNYVYQVVESSDDDVDDNDDVEILG